MRVNELIKILNQKDPNALVTFERFDKPDIYYLVTTVSIEHSQPEYPNQKVITLSNPAKSSVKG